MGSTGFSRTVDFAPAQHHAESERFHVEHVIAIARVVMCLACATAFTANPIEHPASARTILLVYTLLSILFLGFLSSIPLTRFHLDRVLHATDCFCAAVIVGASEGSSSPYFVLFLFCVLSAAYRWRLRETLLTAVALGVMMLGYAPALTVAPSVRATFVTEASFLGVSAVLAGLLAEYEKGQREQSAVIADLLAGIQAQRGFRLTLKYVASALLRLTNSTAMLVAAREMDSDRAVLWSARHGRAGTTLLTSTDLARDDRLLYLFPAKGDGWSVVRGRRDTCSVVAIDRDGDTIPRAKCELDPRFWQFHPHRAMLCVCIGFGVAWRGRVYLLRGDKYSLATLRFVHLALGQLMPAIHNQYLLRRLRSRAGAAERRRVARELHDGVIQSLHGLEMRAAALRSELARTHPQLDEPLLQLQRVLGEEARSVRDMMHQIRPFEAGPGQFVPALAEIVERFSRDTGIGAEFVGPPQEVYVPPSAARELARTLQEALTNVRRHSGARRVSVLFQTDAEAWHLHIENDGRPFGFLGRLDLDELEARRLGPRVIKERVREMGGCLVIESSAHAGVRLEIALPRPEGQSRSA